MENIATTSPEDSESVGAQEMRGAPRFTLLIRAARLVAAQGEFVCVIRDISETGVSVRLFHALPPDDTFELHMPGGRVYSVKRIWVRENEAGLEFANPVDVAQIINEVSEYPKRGLRLGLHFPITITSLTDSCEGVVENLSQQGARFECDALFAIDQTLRLSGAGAFKDVRAKVRWRRDRQYGVVFDDTFTLGDFARFAARLQAPSLLAS
ncbi:PilZ domain-containing protein [Erythrobacter sp. THAF29]|uniref:PilZ domain-containing protein n=1 Tax=Erythrobacter sp. THAF29 TaxID=2587851 RepID=UPI0012691110|nr:PilZ domain-containing protein [Erythrobacter sp. THAF29]QFT76492.1 PilZ domain protein [Erythrobacter sp. THAF29]